MHLPNEFGNRGYCYFEKQEEGNGTQVSREDSVSQHWNELPGGFHRGADYEIGFDGKLLEWYDNLLSARICQNCDEGKYCTISVSLDR